MSKIRLFGTSSGYVEIAPAAAASNNTLTAPSTVGEIIAKDAAGAIGVTSVHTTNIVATGTTKVGAAVTITESGIEASGIGITCANINGGQISGRRNLVTNGAMLVAQRGTSSTTNGYGSVDRFSTKNTGTDEAPTHAQVDVASGTTPYSLGFRKALKITNGNQTSGAGAGDYIKFNTQLEAQDIASSGWSYTDSNSKITIQFWVKSSVAQTFFVRVTAIDSPTYNFPFSYTVSANTWTKVTKTISGNSNLVFNNDNGSGLDIEWTLFRGTNTTGSGATLDTWAAYDSSQRQPDNTSTWYTTNDATWEITGVQLEVGTQASAFEHRTFNDELSLCHRYFQKYTCSSQEWIYLEGSGASYKWWQSHFHPMRTTPTVDVSGLSTGSGTNAAGLTGEISSLSVTGTSAQTSSGANGRVSYRVTFSADSGTARTLHHTDSWSGDSVTYSAEL